MEPIGHLNGLRSATRGGAGILAASVAAHMSDLRMGLHPDCCGFCLTVWQQINEPLACPGSPGPCRTFCHAKTRNHQCPDTESPLLTASGEPSRAEQSSSTTSRSPGARPAVLRVCHRSPTRWRQWFDTVVSSSVLKASHELGKPFHEDLADAGSGVTKERGAREESTAPVDQHRAGP